MKPVALELTMCGSDDEFDDDLEFEPYYSENTTKAGASPPGAPDDVMTNMVPRIPSTVEKAIIENVLQEAFLSGDKSSLIESIKAECGAPVARDWLLYRAIRLSLDKDSEKQQWMSEVVTLLHDSSVLDQAQVNRAFEKLIQQAEDMRLDVPRVHSKILAFIRCAVEDHVLDSKFPLRLPESFLVALSEDLKSFSETQPNVEAPAAETSGKSQAHDWDELVAHLAKLRMFKSRVESVLSTTFFVSRVWDDIDQLLLEQDPSRELRHEVVVKLVRVAMDRAPQDRELVSSMLSNNFGGEIGSNLLSFTADDIRIGFYRLLGMMEDTRVDVPNAPNLLSKFIVRAIADEVLAPVFVADCARLGIGGPSGRHVLQTVHKWLRIEHRTRMSLTRFRHTWLGAPDQPVELRHVIAGYLEDRDLDTTRAQFLSLDLTPDQISRFVRKALEISMERSDAEREGAIDLLKGLREKHDIDKQAVRQGFLELVQRLEQVELDIPNATAMMQYFINRAKDSDLLTKSAAIEALLTEFAVQKASRSSSVQVGEA